MTTFTQVQLLIFAYAFSKLIYYSNRLSHKCFTFKIKLKECACGPLGSASLVCDYTTGQCDCKSNVATANKPNVLGLVDDLQCRSCMTNTFGYSTGEGCQFCNCKTEGSNSSQCDDFGACPCKETFNGDKCDTCELGYFAYASTGCTPCDCDESGSNGIGCDILTGKCDCKTNVDGTKCDTCKIGFFNLSPLNPDGCQPCFCYGHGTSCTSASGFTSDVIYAQGTTQWPQTGDNEYILAPDEFLGDQVTTYGNDINIEIRARGFGFILGEEKVVVLQGGGLEAFVQLPGTPLGFEYLNLKIPMRESEWRYIVISTLGAVAAPLPAADFFKILGNLTAIQIRRNYEGRLVDILSLSTTKAKLAEPGDVEVGFVENCTCVATDFVGASSEWESGSSGNDISDEGEEINNAFIMLAN
ncbi:hypothetical protein CAPTEDRAFT_228147 [Capitella teleta]|uniref:Laminin EGF-like domain-containing protein n=1 Tax=Capitella teleta TaxID=283909 RepID=R7UMM6_CAPTE|nr:hypothetical protein CAPTEDRAFT_228147 [Capitella teleta]|eukprot:ELU05177.1 hypothetical protein CAPTEDRAFT_228147 [Capitella teleta]